MKSDKCLTNIVYFYNYEIIDYKQDAQYPFLIHFNKLNFS